MFMQGRERLSEVRAIRRVVGRLRWRLRAQTAVRWGAFAAALAAGVIVVGVGLYATWLIPPDTWQWFVAAAAGLLGLGVLAGLIRRWDLIGLAQRLDGANDLKDRLGTALQLLAQPEAERTEFEEAQIRDAVAHSRQLEYKSAAPWRMPRELLWVAGLLAVAWGLTWVRMGPPQDEHPGLRAVFFGTDSLPLPGAPPDSQAAAETLLDEETVLEVEHQLEVAQQELEPLALGDAESMEFVAELNKTLQALAEGKLDDRQLVQEAAALEETLEELAAQTPEERQEQEQTAETLARVGQELERQADRIGAEDLAELGEMLQEERYEEAAERLRELLERFERMSPEEQERIAKLLENLARRFESQLQRQMNRLQRQRDRLARRGENREGGPTRRQRDRLNRMNRQLERLNRQQEQQGQQNGQQRNLDQLSREMRDMANRMRREDNQQQQQQGQNQQGQNQQAQDPNGPQGRSQRQQQQQLSQQEMRQLQEMMRRMGQQQRRDRLRQQGQMRMADLRELMRRRNGMQGEGRRRLEQLARQGQQQGQRGQRPGQQGQQQGQQGQQQGQQPGQEGQEQGTALQRGNGDPRQGVEWMRVDQPQDTPTGVGGAREGEGIGHGRNRMLQGDATDIEATLEDDYVRGTRGEGPSTREVLLGAAQQGTQVRGYGKVHIDYSMRASEQMENAEIPPGYREYVDEYFRLIRRRQ